MPFAFVWSLALRALRPPHGPLAMCPFFGKLWLILWPYSRVALWIFCWPLSRVLRIDPFCLGLCLGILLSRACTSLSTPSGFPMIRLLAFHLHTFTGAIPVKARFCHGAVSCICFRPSVGFRAIIVCPGTHMSVELYGRDDIAPMLEFQRLVLQQVRSGFRPLQPIARGASAPLPRSYHTCVACG